MGGRGGEGGPGSDLQCIDQSFLPLPTNLFGLQDDKIGDGVSDYNILGSFKPRNYA